MSAKIYAAPATTENSFLDSVATGLASSLKWKLLAADGTVVIAEVTGTGITEIEPTVYRKQFTVPDTQGDYLIVWTNGSTRVTEELVVTYSLPAPSSPGLDTPYFTVAQARATGSPLDNTTLYPDADIDAKRVMAEQELERACGVAFVTRTTTETFTGNGRRTLLLRWPLVTAITAVSVNGVAYTTGQLAALVPLPTGVVDNPAYWLPGTSLGNVTITYQHGHNDPELPGEASRIALRLARHYLVGSAMDDRITRGKAGEEEFTFAVAGASGRWGIPEVDAFVADHQMPVVA